MSIQGNVNQLLSVAGMLYTQTASYEEYKGREQYIRNLKRKEAGEKRTERRGIDTQLEMLPETREAQTAYETHGGSYLKKRAERAYSTDTQLFPSYGRDPMEYVSQMGVDLPSTGADRRTITQLSRATGLSRGESATVLRQAHEQRRKARPAQTATPTTPATPTTATPEPREEDR